MRPYAFTIFVGAFLLFQVEPMLAKYILPWFGGTPAVWTTCLLFFQVLLLAGYAYAHLIGTKLPPRRQMIAHLALIALCILTMGLLAIVWKSALLPGSSWKPAHADFPVPRILLVLSVSIGLPYFVLSATAPLLQSWFVRTYEGTSPYRLYALSNLGSLLALLSYPFVVEPSLSLKAQANMWSGLYLFFAAGMVLCAMPLRDARPLAAPVEADGAIENPSRSTYVLWIALAACASLLLYGATNQMTQDIAPIPFLWVLPLALYLLSFVICFDGERWYRRGVFHPLFAIAVFCTFLVAVYIDRIAASVGHRILSTVTVNVLLQVGNASLLLFAGCMVCHGELVRLKPGARNLTAFYLMVSAGGALGGIFAVAIAPLIFRGFWEYRLSVWSCAVLMTIVLTRDRTSWIYLRKPIFALLIFAPALALPLLLGIVEHTRIYAALAFVAGALAVTFALWRNTPRLLARPGRLAQLSLLTSISVLGVIYIETVSIALHDTLLMTRNFYGVFRVEADEARDHSWHAYRLVNGRITHGEQFLSQTDPRLRYYPTTYYNPNSGIGLVLMNHPRRADGASLRIGVVGLGTGTIAAWGRPGDNIRFYEINPAIIKIVTDPNGYFSFLRDSSAKVVVVPGDARLSMEREVQSGNPQQFDVLAIDAFNGDAIPTHLLTREAMQIYLSELSPDGVIAIHVSNRFLDLTPVVAEHGRAFNLRYGWVHVSSDNPFDWPSDWVLLSRNDRVLSQPEIAAHLDSLDAARRVRPWTDDYSNLFQLLR